MFDSSSPLFTPLSSPSHDATSAGFGGAATIETPSIPGLFYIPHFINDSEANQIVNDIAEQGYFDVEKGRDQAVFFGSRDKGQHSGLPRWTQAMLSLVEDRLRSGQTLLPPEVLDLLFPRTDLPTFQGLPSYSSTRQLILNCYQPGQGIASHIDLPHKFLDGIMIISFGSGIAMSFKEENGNDSPGFDIYLVPGSLCVLSGESRWKWSHGIPARGGDWVWDEVKGQDKYITRGQRFSITVRWYRLEDESEDNHELITKDDKRAGRSINENNRTGDSRLTSSHNG